MLEKKEIISAVSEQVRRSGKYPVLVNEGIVALSLVSGNGEKGGEYLFPVCLLSFAKPSFLIISYLED